MLGIGIDQGSGIAWVRVNSRVVVRDGVHISILISNNICR